MTNGYGTFILQINGGVAKKRLLDKSRSCSFTTYKEALQGVSRIKTNKGDISNGGTLVKLN